MSSARLVYNALLPAAEVGARAAAYFLPKMREAIDGRRDFRARWSALARDLVAPPVWFHVASVGEFEQARPVISALERARPDVPVVLTFSSPSGYHFAKKRESIGEGRHSLHRLLALRHGFQHALLLGVREAASARVREVRLVAQLGVGSGRTRAFRWR